MSISAGNWISYTFCLPIVSYNTNFKIYSSSVKIIKNKIPGGTFVSGLYDSMYPYKNLSTRECSAFSELQTIFKLWPFEIEQAHVKS